MEVLTDRLMVTILRWTARTIGIALLGAIAVFIIGEGVPNPLRGSFRENLLGISILTMVIGEVEAWRWEGIWQPLYPGRVCPVCRRGLRVSARCGGRRAVAGHGAAVFGVLVENI